MKKLISILICVAMVLSLIPAVAAAGAGTVEQELESVEPKYAATSEQGGTYSYDPDTNILSVTGMQTRRYATAGAHAPFAVIPFTATASGEYNIQLRTNVEAATSATVNVYIITQADGDKNYTAVKNVAAGYETHASTFLGTKTHSKLEQDALTLAKSIGYVNLAAAKKDTYVSATEYNTETGVLGEKAGIVELTEGTAYYIIIAPDANSTMINDKVSGNGSTVTQRMYISGIKLVPVSTEEPEDAPAGGTVSFAQTTNIDGFEDIAIESVNRGEAVELTAHKQSIPGYKFIGWKRGADTSEKNSWVEISGDTYNVWTDTYLTAIYEKETDVTEKAVEFWNQNGAYIGKMDEATYNAQDELFQPSLVGFGSFDGWFTEEDVPFTAGMTLADGITNVVAQYSASAVSNVTFGGESIQGAGTYDTQITLPATTSATTCWKRDGEIIAYGDSYTFNVWDATDITEGTEEIEAKVPVAILDYSAKHEAYMLEYDAGDYEIVEAGIIFGKDTAGVKKFTSQRKVSHNQFTVPEEDGLDATGYIIYTLDGGTSYKVKYVTVKAAE